jgi:hypothetical protein
MEEHEPFGSWKEYVAGGCLVIATLPFWGPVVLAREFLRRLRGER